MIRFEIQKEESSVIKVIGVGGGGNNAVNHMFREGIIGVEFIVCNTDSQALEGSPVSTRVQLGSVLTRGRGAGAVPEVGKNAAIESLEQIKEMLSDNTDMVFITAGMGGGTGTGAAPIIAGAAKEMGILTVGIVTVPFSFEGKKRRAQAESGLDELRNNVDTLIVISNDKLRQMHGDQKLSNAFAQADNVVATAAKSISEIIKVHGKINVDFNDIKTVMTNGGAAIMGAAETEGESRAINAVENALNSPLLNDSDIKGASQVLLYITSGNDEVTMDELGEISEYIQDEAGDSANVIIGTGVDESLGERIRVIVIATGFSASKETRFDASRPVKKVVNELVADEIVAKVAPVELLTTDPIKEENTTGEQSLEPVLIIKTPAELSNIPFEVVNSGDEELPFAKMDFESNTATPEIEEKMPEMELKTIIPGSAIYSDKPAMNDFQKRAEERIAKLKELTAKLRTPSGISEMEKQPAFVRKNVQLDNKSHSSVSQVSRYTLSEGDDKKTDLRANNSFLHDAVD